MAPRKRIWVIGITEELYDSYFTVGPFQNEATATDWILRHMHPNFRMRVGTLNGETIEFLDGESNARTLNRLRYFRPTQAAKLLYERIEDAQ